MEPVAPGFFAEGINMKPIRRWYPAAVLQRSARVAEEMAGPPGQLLVHFMIPPWCSRILLFVRRNTNRPKRKPARVVRVFVASEEDKQHTANECDPSDTVTVVSLQLVTVASYRS
jgi:hypothetical protein